MSFRIPRPQPAADPAPASSAPPAPASPVALAPPAGHAATPAAASAPAPVKTVQPAQADEWRPLQREDQDGPRPVADPVQAQMQREQAQRTGVPLDQPPAPVDPEALRSAYQEQGPQAIFDALGLEYQPDPAPVLTTLREHFPEAPLDTLDGAVQHFARLSDDLALQAQANEVWVGLAEQHPYLGDLITSLHQGEDPLTPFLTAIPELAEMLPAEDSDEMLDLKEHDIDAYLEKRDSLRALRKKITATAEQRREQQRETEEAQKAHKQQVQRAEITYARMLKSLRAKHNLDDDTTARFVEQATPFLSADEGVHPQLLDMVYTYLHLDQIVNQRVEAALTGARNEGIQMGKGARSAQADPVPLPSAAGSPSATRPPSTTPASPQQALVAGLLNSATQNAPGVSRFRNPRNAYRPR